jgi:GNAT superfamily N-acetyltransferase
MLSIVRFEPEHLGGCRRVFETIPDWFGIPASNEAYLRGLGELPAWVALENAEVLGFASVRPHFKQSAELEVLAVRRDRHRRGIGRGLVDACEEWARRRGVLWLHVKTLGPSDPDPGYANTRAFYRSLGFFPLFETELWGPENPTLVSVRQLDRPVEHPVAVEEEAP